MGRRIGIKIAKGVRLNFGKRGTSLSVSHKNIFGRRTSTTIPLSFGSSGKSHSSNRRTYSPVSYGIYDFVVNDDGTVVFYEKNGARVTDEGLIRKLKSTDDFKRQKARILESRKAERQAEFEKEQQSKYREIQNRTDSVITIHRQCEYVHSKLEYKEELDSIRTRRYTRDVFTEQPPVKDGVRYLLYNEAENNVKAPFWKKKKVIEQYVEDNLENYYNERMDKYNEKREEFERAEDEKERKKNSFYEQEAEDRRNQVRKVFQNDPEYIEETFSKWLESITLTVDFAVDFEYDKDSGCMRIDLALPDISEIPAEKAAKLASGTVKEKPKTQKEIKQDYIQCVFGLAMFVASHYFGISIFAKEAIVSGYAERRDDRTGEMKKDCLFSLCIPRRAVENVELYEKDPQQFCLSLDKCRSNITASLIMKAVEAF